MQTYNRPGVYIQEASTLPPSVAPVATAIPAFIGYTEFGLTNIPTRITSMLEYEKLFGGAYKKSTLSVTYTSATDRLTVTGQNKSLLFYYALQLYFLNGGGPCYIVSVGHYLTASNTVTPTVGDLKNGTEALKKADEPTLICFPDAIGIGGTDYGFYETALSQSEDLRDRFVLIDSLEDDVVGLRTGIDSSPYGAAYHPHLVSSLSYSYDEALVAVTNTSSNLDTLISSNTGLYNKVKSFLAKQYVTLGPSSALAGVYASVDRSRGVWKAPANVSLRGVIRPTKIITDEDQNGLNIDLASGKSVNAIRTFTGKGILVWGARTWAGNSNEWRYVSVRRFFNFVEGSVSKATMPFVFESNDANTWNKVKSMIGNFLNQQWQVGALQGAKPEHAYYVKVGLGETMSPQDILEGHLVVEIGMAVVRPAEFIILKFSHTIAAA